MSQLRILQEYVTRLAHDKGIDVDKVLIAELFDLIGGVGFGGYADLLTVGIQRNLTPYQVCSILTWPTPYASLRSHRGAHHSRNDTLPRWPGSGALTRGELNETQGSGRGDVGTTQLPNRYQTQR
jgi:hypothetical protein